MLKSKILRNKKFFGVLLLFGLSVLVIAQTDSMQSDSSHQPVIRGHIELDSSLWSPVAYLSIIPDFTQTYYISYETIIERADIDDNGDFSFQTDFLSGEDHFYRIHFSKKDDPPASLTIGGKEENHFFLIANNRSVVEIVTEPGYNLINHLSFSGYSPNHALQEINEIVSFLDTLDYYGSNLNRQFISGAVNEKLLQYADTCIHPLVSLYALYKSNLDQGFQDNPEFYKRYLRKWKHEQSDYFSVFKAQIPWESSNNKSVLIILLFITIITISIVSFSIYIFKSRRKTNNSLYTSLTVQERKIFSLLKEGKSNKEISELCSISLSTVKSHINNIYTKLDISSRKEVMDYMEST
ncbi:MAG: helix-turn-helix transcriptional regulator [Bacteroidetes bacterium]|nr:helix-turn-helix transcriptional regulator [Bacteroidota bacterium]MBT7462508.1 helix-turn-helix transcriptional regulator [Bacteroidota bacterium]